MGKLISAVKTVARRVGCMHLAALVAATAAEACNALVPLPWLKNGTHVVLIVCAIVLSNLSKSLKDA